MIYLTETMFLGLPLAAVIFWVFCLVRYRLAKKKNTDNPESVTDAQLKVRKWLFIVATVIASAFVLVLIAFVALLFMAVAFM